MAFCTNCGNKLEDGSRFCTGCGAKVEAEAASPEENAYSAPVYSGPEVSGESYGDPGLYHTPNQEAPMQNSLAFSSEKAGSYDVLSPDFKGFPDQEPEVKPVSANASEAIQKAAPTRPCRKFVTVFCSVLICILLVTLMLPTFTLLTVQNIPKQETLLAAMTSIDMDELPASVIDDNDRSLKRLSFADYICDIINADMNNLNHAVISYSWKDMTPKTLSRFLENTTFLEFFAEHMEGILDAALSGEDSYTFSAKSIRRVMEENKEYIIDAMNISVSDADYDRFVNLLVNSLEADIEVPELDDDVVDVMGLVRSVYVIAGLCLVMVLLVVLLFVTNRQDYLFAVKDTGISFVIGAGLFLLVILGGGLLASGFAGEQPLAYLGITLLSCAARVSLLVAAGVLVLGVILLLVNFFLRKHQRKRMA